MLSIEEVPKDGTKVIVFSPEEKDPFIAYYHPEEEVWVRYGENTIVDVKLVAYQDLPDNYYYKK